MVCITAYRCSHLAVQTIDNVSLSVKRTLETDVHTALGNVLSNRSPRHSIAVVSPQFPVNRIIEEDIIVQYDGLTGEIHRSGDGRLRSFVCCNIVMGPVIDTHLCYCQTTELSCSTDMIGSGKLILERR